MIPTELARRIRKLLRLGESPNANESAAAIAKAHALMSANGIEAAMVDEAAGRDGAADDAAEMRAMRDPLESLSRLPRWRIRLATMLARSLGAMVYTSGGVIKLYGRPADAANVRYLYEFCTREIDALTRTHCAGEGRTYANNFRVGCTEAISASIDAEASADRERMRAEQSRIGSNALVVLSGALARIDARAIVAKDKAYAELGLRKKTTRGGRYDPDARGAGRAAGASIMSDARGQRRLS